MRLVAGALALVLASSVVRAEAPPAPEPAPPAPSEPAEYAPAPTAVPVLDEATPPVAAAAPRRARASKLPVRVVQVMSDTQQALLFDRQRNRHVLAEPGMVLSGFTVDAIDDDEVTLLSRQGERIVLAAPYAAPPRARDSHPLDHDALSPQAASPVDPYATLFPDESIRSAKMPSWFSDAGPGPAGEPGAPAAPGGEEVRSVSASGPGAAEAAPSDAPAPPPPPAEYDTESAPSAPPPPPAEAAPPAPAVPAAATLRRAELDQALSDFGALSVGLRASLSASGIQLEAFPPGSLFARVGLRAGDLVTAIDGRPLRTLDDLAALYARAGSLTSLTVQVMRGGKPTTLRVSIQ